MRVHYGSGNVPAHVALGAGKELAVGQHQLAQLRLEAPVFLFAGDHLTLRDWSEQQTLAGAIVLDPDATRRAFRATERQQWLQRVSLIVREPTSFVAALRRTRYRRFAALGHSLKRDSARRTSTPPFSTWFAREASSPPREWSLMPWRGPLRVERAGGADGRVIARTRSVSVCR